MSRPRSIEGAGVPPEPTPSKGKAVRIQAIDAARGAAMLFVFLSHFGLIYFSEAHAALFSLSQDVGRVASPTFMLISGVMAGYLLESRRQDFSRIRTKLRDRGLFYLVVGHLAITAATVSRMGGWHNASNVVFITDTVGVCMIVGPSLIIWLRPRIRLALAAAMFLASWAGTIWWLPTSAAGELARAVLCGALDAPGAQQVPQMYTFPVLPWLAVYLFATPLGQKIARHRAAGDVQFASRAARNLSITAILSSLAVIVVKRGLDIAGWVTRYPVARFLSRWQKNPPGPVYLLFYTGIGLAILLTTFTLQERASWRRVIRYLTVLGQTSFFLFVLQYYVYYLVLYDAHLPYTVFWPLYFVGSIVVMSSLAWIWHTANGNRYLTVHWSPELSAR